MPVPCAQECLNRQRDVSFSCTQVNIPWSGLSKLLVGWLVGGFCAADCMVYKCNRAWVEINYITEILLVLMKHCDRNPSKEAAPDVP
jgi:hypothetical protein